MPPTQLGCPPSHTTQQTPRHPHNALHAAAAAGARWLSGAQGIWGGALAHKNQGAGQEPRALRERETWSMTRQPHSSGKVPHTHTPTHTQGHVHSRTRHSTAKAQEAWPAPQGQQPPMGGQRWPPGGKGGRRRRGWDGRSHRKRLAQAKRSRRTVITRPSKSVLLTFAHAVSASSTLLNRTVPNPLRH